MDVEVAWQRVVRWMSKNAPEALTRLKAPVTEAALADAERQLQVQLPEEYRWWLARHDGSEEYGPAPEQLLPLEEVLRIWELHEQLARDGVFAGAPVAADPAVRSTWWNPRWIPFTGDGAGNHWCLDLDPANGGRIGQVVGFWHDHKERAVEAPSFGAWLAQLADDLETGAVVATEDQGRFFSIIERSSLKGSLASLRIRGESIEDWRDRVHADAWSSPGATAVSLVEALLKHRRLKLHPGAFAPLVITKVQDVIGGLHKSSEAGAAKVHAAIAGCDQVRAFELTVLDLVTVLERLPFVDELLSARGRPVS
jgi:cell wall assembly regulator SMI1